MPARNLIADAGYTTWGWVHLILGIVLLVTGGGLAFGNTVPRVVGVALAALSALVNLAFIPAALFAATLITGLDVFLIYAITVHGVNRSKPADRVDRRPGAAAEMKPQASASPAARCDPPSLVGHEGNRLHLWPDDDSTAQA